ncbi:MAG: hypothetical protein AB7G28_17545 [Pirellulales bacterium]
MNPVSPPADMAIDAMVNAIERSNRMKSRVPEPHQRGQLRRPLKLRILRRENACSIPRPQNFANLRR